jgi:hypothetical protein
MHSMIEWLKFRRELAKLNAWERAERHEHAGKTAEARKSGKPPPDDGELASLLWLIEDRRKVLLSRRLLREAERFEIPTPQHDDKSAWEESPSFAERFLNTETAAKLRAALRKEKNERWELSLKVVGALTGIVGALIGLVAMLKK